EGHRPSRREVDVGAAGDVGLADARVPVDLHGRPDAESATDQRDLLAAAAQRAAEGEHVLGDAQVAERALVARETRLEVDVAAVPRAAGGAAGRIDEAGERDAATGGTGHVAARVEPVHVDVGGDLHVATGREVHRAAVAARVAARH